MAAVVTKESPGLRSERGQAFVLTVVALVVLLGMAAVGIDVGSWYKAQRHDQAVADAAALAGSQALPDDPAQAVSLAIDYANRNGVSINSSAITITSKAVANDTIKVAFEQPETTVFAKVFGISTVQVGARAVARAGLPGAARYVAPIVVPISNPQLSGPTCTPPPCSGTTTIDLMDLHNPGSGNAAGSFALLDLRFGSGGNPGNVDLANWMQNGYDQYMPLGQYYEAPSANWNSSSFQQSMNNHIGDTVLFPVYQPPIIGQGSGAQFNIVGWVGFVIDQVDAKGSSGSLTGHFVSYLADAIPADSGGNGQGNGQGNAGQNFGVRTITLVD